MFDVTFIKSIFDRIPIANIRNVEYYLKNPQETNAKRLLLCGKLNNQIKNFTLTFSEAALSLLPQISTSNNAIIPKSKALPPKIIPKMAASLSLCFLAGVVCPIEGATEGDTAGVKGESFSGDNLLPEKSDLGNLFSDLGTVPLSSLFDRLRNCKFGNWRSGISPERELFERFNATSCVRFEIDAGMFPVKLLNERSSTVRFFQTEKSNGREPEKEFSWRCNPVREVRLAKSEGNGPVNPLARRLRI